jgi:TfoX/Sxy family transcriptional regulator of competence genes
LPVATLVHLGRSLLTSAQEFLESGKMWEKSRNFPLAIQSYLSVTRSHSEDADELVSVWQHAIRLASEHEKHTKFVEIADDVANRCAAVSVGCRYPLSVWCVPN